MFPFDDVIMSRIGYRADPAKVRVEAAKTMAANADAVVACYCEQVYPRLLIYNYIHTPCVKVDILLLKLCW